MSRKEIEKKVREFFKGAVTISKIGKRRCCGVCELTLNASRLENLISEEDLEDMFFHIFKKLFPNLFILRVKVFEHSDIGIYLWFSHYKVEG